MEEILKEREWPYYEDDYGNTRCKKCRRLVEGGYCDCFISKKK